MSDIKADDLEATEEPVTSDVLAEDDLDTLAGGGGPHTEAIKGPHTEIFKA